MPDHGFQQGDWLIDRHNPGERYQFTGREQMFGPNVMLELECPNGQIIHRVARNLLPMARETIKPLDRMLAGLFGRPRDLKRLITYEKLRGCLHEVIYSMEAAQIDFYPYQFKPVMKLINAPTERLILADEVGLGKTIEAALIWIELQARRQAKRLLVVAPSTLATKWRDELRQKFLIDARIVDFPKLRDEIDELDRVGPSHEFTLIATYTGLRPPKAEVNLLRRPPDDGECGTEKTEFLRRIRHSAETASPFDLVIFDEAHYMRNSATTNFRLGEALSACAEAVICVSATPVNNSNADLHSLLRLVDEDFFESQGMFETLLASNKPAVRASSALARVPFDRGALEAAAGEMNQSEYIRDSPIFHRFLHAIRGLNPDDKAAVAKCQSMAESLNLLGQYVNRTRRVEVKENRAVRTPLVLTIDYTDGERRLYESILKLVRARCKQDSRRFHVFQMISLQLRAASCLPALAQEVRESKFGDFGMVISEAFGSETFDDVFGDSLPSEEFHLNELLDYDYEENDSKYRELRRLLFGELPDEKVVIFSFYRGTLAYLFRRLQIDGIEVAMIHGGISTEDRWLEIKRFRDIPDCRVLLSSEVGSEGIDLQFCRVVTNYDLPWNPMRVEQRIGRIDRVGQKAQRLTIVNFKVRDTVEERLYDNLHVKLLRFENSLGDLEAIIGQEVENLTVDLLSQELTREEEKLRMERTAQAFENQKVHLEELENSSDALIALSDYLQRRIEDARGRGRYMQADELDDYVLDFFRREFRGTSIEQNTPLPGCMRIKLSQDAYDSLCSFTRDDRSLSARPFRARPFTLTFRRDVMERLSEVQFDSIHFANHLSPLIRWITKINTERSHALQNVAAIKLSSTLIPPGVYCYQVERWLMRGIIKHEKLQYALKPLFSDQTVSPDTSESILQEMLHRGRDWDRVVLDPADLERAFRLAEGELACRFGLALEDFDAENSTLAQIREQRIRAFYGRRMEQDRARIETLNLTHPSSRVLNAANGRLRQASENCERKLEDLRTKKELDVEKAHVASGVLMVEG